MLSLVGKYCFVIIQVAWDKLVFNCWVWEAINVKFLDLALRIKRGYQKCDWERGGKKSGDVYKDNI